MVPSPTSAARYRRGPAVLLGAMAVVIAMAAAGCGKSPTSAAPPQGPATQTGPATAGIPVLPVKSDPISNPSTVQALKLDSILVENNVDSMNNPVSDHIEVTAENTGTTTLGGFEVFYTVTDPQAKLTEHYYTRFPATFTVPPGATRTFHFDTTGAADHFPVNKYGLFYTSKDALDIKVEVSATGAAIQAISAHKAAGGAENPSQ